MQQLLTGKKRLPRFAKSSGFKDIEIGAVPEDWEVVKVSNVIQNGEIKRFIKEPEICGDYPVIQQGNVPIAGYAIGEPFKDYEKSILFGDHTLSLYKPVKPFFIASDGIKNLIVKTGNPNYIFYVLEKYMPISEGYKRHFSILKNVSIPITSNGEEQAAIAELLSSMDEEIETLGATLEKYRNLKIGMMQQLLTGRIRLA